MNESANRLTIDYACCCEAGVRPDNADVCDVIVPQGDLLRSKGIAAAIADGMSSSEGGREAAEICVQNFLTDYLSTPESWTVRTSAGKVLGALNRWLFSQGQTVYESPRGMVTTFSGLIIKSTTAHVIHVGDSRIYRYRDNDLEQLTRDHRLWVSANREFLSRAVGADPHIEIDYRSVSARTADIFLFTTDGVHEFLTHNNLLSALEDGRRNLQACANRIVEMALTNGSKDNVSCQLVRIEDLPVHDENDVYQQLSELPFPPNLEPGMKIDGYEILRELHASSRSEVFLALDTESAEKVVLKTPSANLSDDPEHLDAFLHEEWVGRRVRNAHVLRLLEPKRRRFLYNISEYVKGQSLEQWMADHPVSTLDEVRDFSTQIIDGLRALHRQEMFHQDLKPANVLIDRHGTLKLIDFGSTRIAGISEANARLEQNNPQGTISYAAPECIRGEPGNKQSDLYSLGVVVYELLTGKLPYGEYDRPNPRRHKKYTPVFHLNSSVPVWVDTAIAKAVNPDPRKRYGSLSEFQFDLSRPNPGFFAIEAAPLIERNPIGFWRGLAAALFILNLILLMR